MVGVELLRESDRLVAAAQHVLASRDGRIALTLVLMVTAAVEANIYTPARQEFPFEGGGGDPTAAVLLNVLAVVPLLATASSPFLAAAGATFLSVVILGSPETPITLSTLAVLLYAVGHLVARRGLLLAIPLVVPFFLNAFVPFDGSDVNVASIGPFVLVATAALAGESSRKRIEAVTALDETQAAMAASVQEQTEMEERATIARELHDIVAHHLSVIAVQSETARLTSPRLSKDARQRFEAIGETARDAQLKLTNGALSDSVVQLAAEVDARILNVDKNSLVNADQLSCRELTATRLPAHDDFAGIADGQHERFNLFVWCLIVD